MTFRQSMEQAFRELGHDEESIKRRLKFSDSQCFAEPNFGIVDKPLSEILRPGFTERQMVDALKKQYARWIENPAALFAGLAASQEKVSKRNENQ